MVPGRYLPVRKPLASEEYGISTIPSSSRAGTRSISMPRSTRLHLSCATVNGVSPSASAIAAAEPSRAGVKFEAPISRTFPAWTSRSKAASVSSCGTSSSSVCAK